MAPLVDFDGVQIAARAISVAGPRGCAFANVSLDVAAGQLAVIAGMAGSGRTSLLLALAGRIRPVTGMVAVGEYRLPGDWRRVQRLVAVAQAPPAVELDEYLRVREHIVERLMTGVATASAVAAALDIVGFDAPRRARIGELRPDDRVLLAAALAAAERPGALVVDDADRDCDPDAGRRVWAGLCSLAECGCTLVAASTRVPDLPDNEIGIAVTTLAHPLDRDRIPDGEDR